MSLGNLMNSVGDKEGKHHRKHHKARNSLAKNRLQSQTQLDNYEYNVNVKSLSPESHNRTNPAFITRKQQLVNYSVQSLNCKQRSVNKLT